jgi:hypothetical protein
MYEGKSVLYFKDRETGLLVELRGNISVEQIGASDAD